MNKDYLFGAGLSRLLNAFNLQNKGLYIEILKLETVLVANSY
jgi:hypothetical protein